MNVVKLIEKYPKLKNLSRSLNFLKNCFKEMKETHKENAGEFK